jgi:hypothetical protein
LFTLDGAAVNNFHSSIPYSLRAGQLTSQRNILTVLLVRNYLKLEGSTI